VTATTGDLSQFTIETRRPATGGSSSRIRRSTRSLDDRSRTRRDLDPRERAKDLRVRSSRASIPTSSWALRPLRSVTGRLRADGLRSDPVHRRDASHERSSTITIAIDSVEHAARKRVRFACDLRFASVENAILGQPEVGVGILPGGGAISAFRFVGSGPWLEIIATATTTTQ